MPLSRRDVLSLPLAGALAAEPADIADLLKQFAALKQLVSHLSRTSPPVGTIVAFAGEWPPKRAKGPVWTEPELGWALCDGRPMAGDEYAELRAVLGKAVRLPDFRGRTLVGAGSGMALSPRPLGSIGGEESHTLLVTEMPAHAHAVTDPGHKHIYPGDAGQIYGSGGNRQAASYFNKEEDRAGKDRSAKTGISIQSTGGGSPHNNMQPFGVVNFIIKYK
jgi:microcystin-dependent protein